MSPSSRTRAAPSHQFLTFLDDLAVEAPACSEDADPDFQELISELARSPLTPVARPADSPEGRQPLIPVPQSSTDCFFMPEKLAALQDFGLRSSPASTNKRKRQYSSTGDLAHLPSRFSWETESSGDSDRTTSATKVHAGPIKRAFSSSQSCTLMPFSLVKAFPSQETLSLSDVNRRIQLVAEGDGVPACQSQDSVNSLCESFLPASTPFLRSPFRPQITVVKQISSPMLGPSSPYSFGTKDQFP